MERTIHRSDPASTVSLPCNDKTIYVACDNGVSGSFAWVNETGSESGVVSTPTFVEQDFQKDKKNVTRVNVLKLVFWFNELPKGRVRVVLERPFVNPMMFNATLSAIRAWEATLIALQEFNYPRQVIDSKRWQKEMLPAGCKGKELKAASVQVGCRLFPDHSDWIKDQGDADSLLIAEFSRCNRL
jgi:hypothetical protein